jgi:hypothetical protein
VDNAQDKGKNQWYSHASGNPLEVFVDFFKGGHSSQKKDTGNHYDDYDEAEEGCIAENGLCISPQVRIYTCVLGYLEKWFQ